MSRRERRRALLHALIESACRHVQWRLMPGASAQRPLVEAFGSLERSVMVPNAELVAGIGDDLRLRISVRATHWSPVIEAALHDGVRSSGSLLAGLVLVDWPDIKSGGRRELGEH